MAQRTTTTTYDDLTGEEGAKTRLFGVGGTSFEVDLTDENFEKFMAELSPYIASGRRVTSAGGRGLPAPQRQSARGASAEERDRLRRIREWARGQGYEVQDRGRIAQKIVDAYDQAHGPQWNAA